MNLTKKCKHKTFPYWRRMENRYRSFKRQLRTHPKSWKTRLPRHMLPPRCKKILEKVKFRTDMSNPCWKVCIDWSWSWKSYQEGRKEFLQDLKQAWPRLWAKPIWKKAGPKVVRAGLQCDLGSMHQRNRKVHAPIKKAYPLCVCQLFFL